jgi:hypothetical protein
MTRCGPTNLAATGIWTQRQKKRQGFRPAIEAFKKDFVRSD